jgi:hypothetical protein
MPRLPRRFITTTAAPTPARQIIGALVSRPFGVADPARCTGRHTGPNRLAHRRSHRAGGRERPRTADNDVATGNRAARNRRSRGRDRPIVRGSNARIRLRNGVLQAPVAHARDREQSCGRHPRALRPIQVSLLPVGEAATIAVSIECRSGLASTSCGPKRPRVRSIARRYRCAREPSVTGHPPGPEIDTKVSKRRSVAFGADRDHLMSCR